MTKIEDLKTPTAICSMCQHCTWDIHTSQLPSRVVTGKTPYVCLAGCKQTLKVNPITGVKWRLDHKSYEMCSVKNSDGSCPDFLLKLDDPKPEPPVEEEPEIPQAEETTESLDELLKGVKKGKRTTDIDLELLFTALIAAIVVALIVWFGIRS